MERADVSADDELLDPAVDVTLGNCDREPIHIPGSIQPHGLLLTVSDPDLRVAQVSDNAPAHLGRAVEQVLGTPVRELLGDVAGDVIAHLDGGSVDASVTVPGASGATGYDLSAHRSGRVIVCELEPGGREVAGEVAADTAGGLQSVTEGAERLFARAASEVRSLTGYDRVMVYRFDDDGHGEVVGEAHSPRLDPLLGHHYPATDIPRQARALYLRQILRMIVDVDYVPSVIVPGDDPQTGEPLDLGLATLRSVSPIHLQYLRNMGVVATLTISLIRDGALWGMIACHHGSRLYVPRRVRGTCRFIGELLSAQLSSMEAVDQRRERDALAAERASILKRINDAPDLVTGLHDVAERLAEWLVADGVTVTSDTQRITSGFVPDPETEREILTHVRARQPLVIDRLSREMPFVSHETELSGVLALPLSRSVGGHVVWYRDDWARELNWGGDPNASLRPDLTSMDVKTLSPRRSFETWRQAVVGQSRPWTEAQVDAATELVEALARIDGQTR